MIKSIHIFEDGASMLVINEEGQQIEHLQQKSPIVLWCEHQSRQGYEVAGISVITRTKKYEVMQGESQHEYYLNEV